MAATASRTLSRLMVLKAISKSSLNKIYEEGKSFRYDRAEWAAASAPNGTPEPS